MRRTRSQSLSSCKPSQTKSAAVCLAIASAIGVVNKYINECRNDYFDGMPTNLCFSSMCICRSKKACNLHWKLHSSSHPRLALSSLDPASQTSKSSCNFPRLVARAKRFYIGEAWNIVDFARIISPSFSRFSRIPF